MTDLSRIEFYADDIDLNELQAINKCRNYIGRFYDSPTEEHLGGVIYYWALSWYLTEGEMPNVEKPELTMQSRVMNVLDNIVDFMYTYCIDEQEMYDTIMDAVKFIDSTFEDCYTEFELTHIYGRRIQ